MDDDFTYTAYLIPDYVLVSIIIELAACAIVLVACLAVVRRGLPAVVGAAGALVGGTATGLALVEVLAALHREAGPFSWPARVDDLVIYGRPVGLALVGLALLLALARTGRSAPAPLESV